MINDLLPPDLLWTIFHLNVTDEQHPMNKRLYTTFVTTHICREWRRILLGSSTIWGQLIFIDDCRECGDVRLATNMEMLHEILRRSGSSALWVQATWGTNMMGVRLDQSEQRRLFLLRLLEEHWDRIEWLKLRIQGQRLDQCFDPEIIVHFGRPAPKLRVCDIEGPWGPQIPSAYDSTIIPHIYAGTSPGLSLFANSAPRLRIFQWDCLKIPTNAHWLSCLTTFITKLNNTFTQSTGETLEVLSQMPTLVHLELCHSMTKNITDTEEIIAYPTVNLTALKYLRLSQGAVDCLCLLDRFIIPSTCMINLEARFDTEETSWRLIMVPIFQQVFERSMRLHYAGCEIEWLYLDIGINGIAFADKGCFPDEDNIVFAPRITSKAPVISFTWPWNQFRTLGDMKTLAFGIYSIFENTIFENVTTLRLMAESSISSFSLLLRYFVNVIKLEITDETAKELAEYTQTSRQDDPVLFGKLHTLVVQPSSAMVSKLHVKIGNVKKLLLSRRKQWQSIPSIVIRGYDIEEDDYHFFERIRGLESVVVETMEGIVQFRRVYDNYYY